MQVTLAYPYEGHRPDETIDLPEGEAKQLVRDGFARLPETTTAGKANPTKEA